MHRNQISLMPVLRRNLVTRFLPILPLITKSGNQLVVLPVKRNPPIQLPYCKNVPVDISSTRPAELVIDGPNEISFHVVVLQPVVLAITDQQGRLLSPGIDENIVTNIELSLLLTLASKTFHIVPILVIEVHKRFTVPVHNDHSSIGAYIHVRGIIFPPAFIHPGDVRGANDLPHDSSVGLDGNHALNPGHRKQQDFLTLEATYFHSMDPFEHLSTLGSYIPTVVAIRANDLDRVARRNVDVSLAVRGKIAMKIPKALPLRIIGPPRNRFVDTSALTSPGRRRFLRAMGRRQKKDQWQKSRANFHNDKMVCSEQ